MTKEEANFVFDRILKLKAVRINEFRGRYCLYITFDKNTFAVSTRSTIESLVVVYYELIISLISK